MMPASTPTARRMLSPSISSTNSIQRTSQSLEEQCHSTKPCIELHQSLVLTIPAFTGCTRVQYCTTTSSYPLSRPGSTAYSTTQALVTTCGVSTSIGSPTSSGCITTWAACRRRPGWPVFCAPRGAAEKVCTQYAALVPSSLGEKSYSNCSGTCCCSTFPRRSSI
ncbi:hypothetical protein M3J09_001744 [Ascochyta lentis]